jgi:two-component system chemotaxis sensor kinase CheA
MNDMSLILEFVQEAREYIDEVEPTLIEIQHGSEEAGSVDKELINSVFRLFHSMKGSAGFLALTTVTSVTHEAETLLDKIRNGKSSLTVQITTTLCKAIDLFREMLDHIEESGDDNGFTEQAEIIIAKLKKHVAGEPLDDDDAGPPPKVAAPVAVPIAVEPESVPEPVQTIETPPEPMTAEAKMAQATSSLQLSPEMRHGFVLEAGEQLDAAEES